MTEFIIMIVSLIKKLLMKFNLKERFIMSLIITSIILTILTGVGLLVYCMYEEHIKKWALL